MTELYEKSMKKLELDVVLDQLAQCAASQEGKAICRGLQPQTDPENVALLLGQTESARQRIILQGSLSLQGVTDVRPSLDRADRGGSLSPKELLGIAGLLSCTRKAKEYGEHQEEKDALDVFFRSLTANRYLEDKITSSILSEDEIADGASKELGDIRRHMRIQSARIKESLQRLISSPAYAKYLREPIVTLRSDRYVVPVKSEFKNEVPGLVHDVSASGSTFFVEPMSSVNANNALRELLLQEKKEIERILAELSAEAAGCRETICANYTLLVQLDSIFARAKLSLRMDAIAPKIRTDGGMRLEKARHPLIDRKTVVPVTVSLGEEFDTLIITGPNTGGKTVTLKTLGLLTLMAQCGLHIPAGPGSSVCLYASILADIGDEQSIAQSLSTFSAHMKNIVSIVGQCGPDTLVLFDELGAGTDPAEGAALAISLIEHCRKCGCRVAATTHYAELKLYAMRTPGVTNASCEFDVETLQPTYRLLIGVPGKSNAFAISRRLGLPEAILTAAKNTVSQNDRDFEDVLAQLEHQRQQMEAARQEAEQLRRQTEENQKRAEEYSTQIRREREKAQQKARQEAQTIIDEARQAANQAYEELKALRKQMRDIAEVQELNQRQADLRRGLNQAQDKLSGPKRQRPRPQQSRPICPGDTVELLKLGTKASVLAVNQDGTLQLQAGVMKITAKPQEVALLEEEKVSVKRSPQKTGREFHSAAPATELDLRGMDALEAASALAQFLDGAMLANVHQVRIVHGKGTGVLRKTVQEELKRNRAVAKFRLGVYGEGEDGVTIAELK